MSLPHLLLVDDSDAILNFEKAVLSGLYRLSTASNGVEALSKIKQLKLDGVLLDLSMPEMDGDEVLKIVKADPVLGSIPVLIVSSEKDRAEACLRAGAEGFLNKPVLAEELKARIALLLEAAVERERKKSSAYLFVSVGLCEFGLPLQTVISVHSQPATRTKKSPSDFRSQEVDYYGETVGILDLARALGVKYRMPLEDRKLVFLQGQEKLAVCVDSVWDPEELMPDLVHLIGKKGEKTPGAPVGGVLAAVESGRGLLSVLNPEMFFVESSLPSLGEYLSRSREQIPIR